MIKAAGGRRLIIFFILLLFDVCISQGISTVYAWHKHQHQDPLYQWPLNQHKNYACNQNKNNNSTRLSVPQAGRRCFLLLSPIRSTLLLHIRTGTACSYVSRVELSSVYDILHIWQMNIFYAPNLGFCFAVLHAVILFAWCFPFSLGTEDEEHIVLYQDNIMLD